MNINKTLYNITARVARRQSVQIVSKIVLFIFLS